MRADNGAPQPELEIEGAVNQQGERDEKGDETAEVRGRERVDPGGSAQPRVEDAGDSGPGGHVRRAAQGSAERQAPQHHVSHNHPEWCDDDSEVPTAIEDGVRRDARQKRSEPVPREPDAVAAEECAGSDKRQHRDAGTQGRVASGERDRCSDDGRHGAHRDERLHDGCPVEAQAEKWTHAGRVRMTRKLGRVAHGVKREYRTRRTICA